MAKALGTYLTNPDEIKAKLFTGRTDNVIIDNALDYNPQATNQDNDHDGLNNWSEVNVYNTDPLNPDTDNDGINDGTEITFHTDPLDPNSRPARLPTTSPYGAAGLVGLVAGAGALALSRKGRKEGYLN